jgi:hypothetical protein
MNFKFFILFSIIILTIAGCYKTPSYPIEPVITFGGFEKDNDIYTLGDSGWLYIKFTDGDGDLGKANNADSTSKIYIENLKYAALYDSTYVIPQIPQKGTSIAIDGQIGIKLTSLLQPASYQLIIATQDTFSYKIYITDRANHKSNIITTPAIIVKKS